MRHTLQPTALAAGIVACLIGVSAHAATQAELQKIQLYGGVTIAQDSVQSWGPWEQFEAPAAGNRLPMPTFASDASNLYRPIPPVNPPVNPPVDPPPPAPPIEVPLEGFAVFPPADEGSKPRLALVTASLSGTVDTESGLPTYVSATFDPHTALGTTSVPVTSTGRLDLQGFFYSDADGNKVTIPYTIEGIDNDAIQAWTFMSYLNGSEGSPTHLAVGVRTSAADMSALRLGNFTATYSGTTLANGFAFNMNVNFGSSSFNAKIADSNLNVTYVFKGGVSGSNIASTSVTGKGGASVGGGLTGFFTGNQAAGFIGNANVRSTDGTPTKFTLSDTIVAKQTSLTSVNNTPK